MSSISAPPAPAATSFKDRLAQRRRELEERNSFELRVPLYGDLWARYRPLGYADVREIGLRNEQQATTTAEGERNTAADVLVTACVELLEQTGTDEHGNPLLESSGYKWGARAVQELFGIDLPEGVDARTSLQMVFPYPHDTPMMTHFSEYMTLTNTGIEEVEQTLQGESRVPSAGTSSG